MEIVRPALRARAALGIVAVGLAACSPKSAQDSGANGHVSIRFEQPGEGGRALSVGGQEVTLPNNFCYAVHITGDGITSVAQSDDVCGPTTGLGQMSPLAYNRGDTAELTIKIGSSRHFDLIGFLSPLGTDADGRAICGSLAMEIANGAIANDRAITLRVGGSVVTAAPVVFASGTGDIGPGDNVITLQGIPLASSSATSGLALGAAYFRRDISGSGGAACPTSPVNTRPPMTTTAGVGLPAAKASNESTQVKLERVTTTPVLLTSPATSNGSSLSTGLFEIERQKK